MLFGFTAAKAQLITPNQTADSDLVFVTAQIEPQFPGGPTAWGLFLKDYKLKQVIAPSSNAATLTFVVDSHGYVSKVNIENANLIDKGLLNNTEAMAKKLPQWKSAVQNGYNITFRVRKYIALL